jgi:PHP family Zn ribbon phosphoesterase
VKHRIEEKASFSTPQHPYHRPPYLYTIPLCEIITKATGQRNPFTEISFRRWEELITTFGNEIKILFDTEINDIAKVTVPAITEAIQAFRLGNYFINSGGGGKYGTIEFPKEKESLILSV